MFYRLVLFTLILVRLQPGTVGGKYHGKIEKNLPRSPKVTSSIPHPDWSWATPPVGL